MILQKRSTEEEMLGWQHIVSRISDSNNLNNKENHTCYRIGI